MQTTGTNRSVLTVDVEDWFHILDSPATPPMDAWEAMEPRVERNMERLLGLFEATGARATFFWLGWVAERHKDLVRRCRDAGHEVASHGYGHLLACRAGRAAFREDVVRAKACLETITGQPVDGFRAPGFGVTAATPWVLDVVCEAGHTYDASVFPAAHGHGGLRASTAGPHMVRTAAGPLLEVPASVVRVLGRRVSLFGGGYLRLAPRRLITWGVERLRAEGRPLVVYVHPREIDPEQPRLPLSLRRRCKCYVGLRGAPEKLAWLCGRHAFTTMRELAREVAGVAEEGAAVHVA